MILFDALYINNSGGKVLLDYLVKELHRAQLPVFYLLDKRVKGSYPFLSEQYTHYQKANLIGRHYFYRTHSHRWSKVLCFGNIPPTISLDCPVYTYFHQLQYLEIPYQLKLKKKLSLWLKGNFIRLNNKNTTSWLVQTEHVEELLQRKWNIPSSHIQRLPFFPKMPAANDNNNLHKKTTGSFTYVSDGNPHKNHLLLLKAFEAAWHFSNNISLHLTVSDNYPELQQTIYDLRSRGIPVYNHGRVPKENIDKLYNTSEFIIYPSLSESFGLGIIEGITMGCKVIGADLPYLYSVCEPTSTFDPQSVNSITEAMIKANSSHNRTNLIIEDQINDLIKILA